jgi:hypothetical protein
MPRKTIKVNRAPVMTLWAAVVAERLGHDHDAALTLGKAVAGLNAQAKGRRLGIYEERPDDTDETAPGMRPTGAEVLVTVLGRPVPAVQTSQGVRATVKGQPLWYRDWLQSAAPGPVHGYLGSTLESIIRVGSLAHQHGSGPRSGVDLVA